MFGYAICVVFINIIVMLINICLILDNVLLLPHLRGDALSYARLLLDPHILAILLLDLDRLPRFSLQVSIAEVVSQIGFLIQRLALVSRCDFFSNHRRMHYLRHLASFSRDQILILKCLVR